MSRQTDILFETLRPIPSIEPTEPNDNDDSIFKAALYGLLSNTGYAIHTADEAVDRIAKPPHVTDEHWKSNPGRWLPHKINEAGYWLEDTFSRNYTPWSANRIVNGVAGVAPYALGLGILGASAVRTGKYDTLKNAVTLGANKMGIGAKGAGILGEAVPALTVGAALKAPEGLLEGQGAYDEYIKDALNKGTYQRGKTEREASLLSDKALRDNVGLLVGTGGLEEVLLASRPGASFAKSATKKILGGAGINAFEEAAQQVIPKYESGKSWSLTDDDVLESALIGAIAGGAMQGGGVGLNYISRNNKKSSDNGAGDIKDNVLSANSFDMNLMDKWESAPGATDLDNVRPEIKGALNNIASELGNGGKITITGGAEKGYHAEGEFGHEGGWKVDIDKNSITDPQKFFALCEKYGIAVGDEGDHYDLSAHKNGNTGGKRVATPSTFLSDMMNGGEIAPSRNGMTKEEFFAAVAGQESGGNYNAQNGRTGAWGKYQIMPENWSSWAEQAGLSPNADMTDPQNQEIVARHKLGEYFDKYGAEGALVAWYAGEGNAARWVNGEKDAIGEGGHYSWDAKQGNGNEPSIREYVEQVLGRVGNRPSNNTSRNTIDTSFIDEETAQDNTALINQLNAIMSEDDIGLSREQRLALLKMAAEEQQIPLQNATAEEEEAYYRAIDDAIRNRDLRTIAQMFPQQAAEILGITGEPTILEMREAIKAYLSNEMDNNRLSVTEWGDIQKVLNDGDKGQIKGLYNKYKLSTPRVKQVKPQTTQTQQGGVLAGLAANQQGQQGQNAITHTAFNNLFGTNISPERFQAELSEIRDMHHSQMAQEEASAGKLPTLKRQVNTDYSIAAGNMATRGGINGNRSIIGETLEQALQSNDPAKVKAANDFIKQLQDEDEKAYFENDVYIKQGVGNSRKPVLARTKDGGLTEEAAQRYNKADWGTFAQREGYTPTGEAAPHTLRQTAETAQAEETEGYNISNKEVLSLTLNENVDFLTEEQAGEVLEAMIDENGIPSNEYAGRLLLNQFIAGNQNIAPQSAEVSTSPALEGQDEQQQQDEQQTQEPTTQVGVLPQQETQAKNGRLQAEIAQKQAELQALQANQGIQATKAKKKPATVKKYGNIQDMSDEDLGLTPTDTTSLSKAEQKSVQAFEDKVNNVVKRFEEGFSETKNKSENKRDKAISNVERLYNKETKKAHSEEGLNALQTIRDNGIYRINAIFDELTNEGVKAESAQNDVVDLNEVKAEEEARAAAEPQVVKKYKDFCKQKTKDYKKSMAKNPTEEKRDALIEKIEKEYQRTQDSRHREETTQAFKKVYEDAIAEVNEIYNQYADKTDKAKSAQNNDVASEATNKEAQTKKVATEGEKKYQLAEGYKTESGRTLEEANEKEFIIRPNGSVDFGEISNAISNATKEQSGETLPVGKIRLRVGNEREGLKHAKGHEAQAKRDGYNSVEDMITDVASNFDEIYMRQPNTDNGNVTYSLVKLGDKKQNKLNGVTPIYLNLESDGKGNYYVIISTIPKGDRSLAGQIKKEHLIYSRAAVVPAATSNGDTVSIPVSDKVGAKQEGMPTSDKTNVPTKNIPQTEPTSKDKNSTKQDTAQQERSQNEDAFSNGEILPELKGSEKQIAWAKDIRDKVLNRVDKMKAPNELSRKRKDLIIEWLQAQTDSRLWIGYFKNISSRDDDVTVAKSIRFAMQKGNNGVIGIPDLKNIKYERDDIVEKLKSNTLNQSSNATYDTINRIITLMESANASTFIHENGHHYLNVLREIAKIAGANSQAAKDLATIEKWASYKEGMSEKYEGTASEKEFAELEKEIKAAEKKGDTKKANELKERFMQERFARAVEEFVTDNIAPMGKLKKIFANFKKWLAEIYSGLKGAGVKPSAEVRAVMERMFASDKEIASGRASRLTGDTKAAYEKALADLKAAGVENAEANAYIAAKTAERLSSAYKEAGEDRSAVSLLPEIRTQEKSAQNEKEAVRKKYEGTKEWLKAPNGEDTNLTEDQWLTVRTPSFKKWFGDWENDPKNASKVVDENGEPKVVYHGSNKKFNIFKYGELGFHFGTQEQAQVAAKGQVEWNQKGKSHIIDGFLNIRNPMSIDYDPETWNDMGSKFMRQILDEGIISEKEWNKLDYYGLSYAKMRSIREKIQQAGYDGIIYPNWYEFIPGEERRTEFDDSFIVFNSNQIKSATDNNGEFNENDPSILHQKPAKSPIEKFRDNFDNGIKSWWTDKGVGISKQKEIFEDVTNEIREVEDKLSNAESDADIDAIREKLDTIRKEIDNFNEDRSEYYKDYYAIKAHIAREVFENYGQVHETRIRVSGRTGQSNNTRRSTEDKGRNGNGSGFNAESNRNGEQTQKNIGTAFIVNGERDDAEKHYQKIVAEHKGTNKQQNISPTEKHSNTSAFSIAEKGGKFRAKLNAIPKGKEKQLANIAGLHHGKVNGDTYTFDNEGERVEFIRKAEAFLSTADEDTKLKFSIDAWHGNGLYELIDKFSLKFLGTGEGAQAHGWGLYFAKSREVGEGYRYSLSEEEFSINGVRHYMGSLGWVSSYDNKTAFEYDDAEGVALKELSLANGDIEKAIQKLNDNTVYYHDFAKKSIAFLRNAEIMQIKQSGHLYHVQIPSEDVMLDEQKTFSEQSEKIQKILRPILTSKKFEKAATGGIAKMPAIENLSGRVIYNTIAKMLSGSIKNGQKSASEFLNKYGIKGITYDGRTDGRCYVVFDDNAIDIIEKFSAEKLSENAIAKLAAKADIVKMEDLTAEEKRFMEMGEKLGTPVVWVDADPRLNGWHKDGVTFINRNRRMSGEKTFWHEALHFIVQNEDGLLEELADTVGITDEQIKAWKDKTGRYELSSEEVIEEMLCDAFHDPASRVKVFQEIAGKNPSLMEKIMAWINRLKEEFFDVFRGTQGKLTQSQKNNMTQVIDNHFKNLKGKDGKPLFKRKGREWVFADGRSLENAIAASGQGENRVKSPIENELETGDNEEKIVLSRALRKIRDDMDLGMVGDTLLAKEHADLVKLTSMCESFVKQHGVTHPDSVRLANELKGAYENVNIERQKFGTTENIRGLAEILRRNNKGGKRSYLAEEIRRYLDPESNTTIPELVGQEYERTFERAKTVLKKFGLVPDLTDNRPNEFFKNGLLAKYAPQQNTSNTKHSANIAGASFSASVEETPNSNETVWQKIKNIFTSDKGKHEQYRRQMKETLENALGVKIRYGKMDESKGAVIYKEKDKVIRSKHAYDWENILPVAGGVVAEKLGIVKKAEDATEAQRNVFANWMLEGKLDDSAEAKAFETAMKDPINAAVKTRLENARANFQTWQDKEADERMQECIQDQKENGKSLKEWREHIYNEVVEEFAPIQRLVDAYEEQTGKKLGVSINPMVAFRLLRGQGERVLAMVNGETELAVKALQTRYPSVDWTNFKTIKDIIGSIGAYQNKEKQNDFATYCVACHMLDLHDFNENLEVEKRMAKEDIEALQRQIDETQDANYKEALQAKLKDAEDNLKRMSMAVKKCKKMAVKFCR